MLPLIVRKSRWRFLLPLVGSLVVLGISVYALMDRGPSWIIWTLMAFSGVSSLVCLCRLIDTQPSLIISEIGICNTHWSIDTISWNDLSSAFIKTDSDGDYVCFMLRDSEEFRSRIGKIGRVFNTATRQTGFGDFTLKPSAMGLDTKEVFELVREQIDQAKAKPKPTGPSFKYHPGR